MASKIIKWLQDAVAASSVALPNSDQVQSWVRTTMGIIGAETARRGWTSDTTWVWLTGDVIFITPFIWGLAVHTLSAKLAAVEAIPQVKAVEIKPTATGTLAAIVADPNRPKVVEQRVQP